MLLPPGAKDPAPANSPEAWFVASGTGFATCPVTQGSLMRLLIRDGQAAESARSVLQEITSDPRHEFWPENASYHDIPGFPACALAGFPLPSVGHGHKVASMIQKYVFVLLIRNQVRPHPALARATEARKTTSRSAE